MKPRAPPLLSFFEGTVSPERSRQMGRIKGRDTRPELALRQEVWRQGARFRVHVRGLPGRPDLANKRAKVAVFVDGCFWHGCPFHFVMPKTRRKFWVEKIRRNRLKRDAVKAVYGPDWTVVEVFECELRDDLPSEARAIAMAIKKYRERE